jgi:transposase
MYCGIDLHSNNGYVVIMDELLNQVAERRLGNDLRNYLRFLEPHREELVSIGVESTYNWYWLVDGLKESDYNVRLMNPSKASNLKELKHTGDRHDAGWIATMQVLGIMPEGYIMPPEERCLRDLLRRRSFMVKERGRILKSMQNVFARSAGKQVSSDQLLKWDTDMIKAALKDPLVAESVLVLVPVVRTLTAQIHALERLALQHGRLREEFSVLQTAKGIGNVLAMAIMCETGDIGRFPSAGDYVSYCRCCSTGRVTNNKLKGKGNKKNGNKYLSWAYSEAGHFARIHDQIIGRYYKRVLKHRHPMVAKAKVAAKISRGCFYVLRDQVPFDSQRAFR